jgi:hypothetical protein
LEFEFLPLMPNKEEINILKAQQQAKVLKREELKKQGVDISSLVKLREEATASNYFNPVHESEENAHKEGENEGLSTSFQEFEVIYSSF